MDLELPPTLVYDYPTAAAISEMILRKLPARPLLSEMSAREAKPNIAVGLPENVAPQGAILADQQYCHI